MDSPYTYVAFSGWKQITCGRISDILRDVKACLDSGVGSEPLLIFEEQTGKQVDFDLRGSIQEVLDRVAPQPRTGPGRPKLGVTSREISLLPRHWDWLEMQSGGASAALRRLVDDARKRDSGESQVRAGIEATGRFMTAIAGNLPDFEEAYRALYAQDRASLEGRIAGWPDDVRSYVLNHFDHAMAQKSAVMSASS